MNEKHTPGPWQTSLSDDTVVIHIGADGVHYEVASIDGDYNEPDLWPIMEANARLIAAAPDLLALALQYRDDLRFPPTGDSAQRRLERAEAIIAKATGA